MIDFVDTHTHLFVEEFDGDRDAAVLRAIEAGVRRLCLPCIDLSSVVPMLQMCERHAGVCFPMMGLHPTEVADDYLCRLEQMHSLLASDDRFIAVGEVGIDLYWDTSRKAQQLDAFERQIIWARNKRLPLVIHSRNAFGELYATMDRHRGEGLTGVFHCFSGTADEARSLLGFDGFMLGIGGALTYKKSTLPATLAKAVPLERIVLETDSPYLAPVPHRGKRNESAYVPRVAEFLAGIYGVTMEHIADVTTANAERIFKKIVQNEH